MKKILTSFILVLSALLFALTSVYANTNKMTVYDVEEQTTLGSANNKIVVNGFYYASEGQLLLDEGSPIDIKGTLIEINLTEPVFVYLPEDQLTIGNTINKITINIGYYADEAQLTIDNGSPIDIKGDLVYIITTPTDTTRPAISGQENFAVSVDDPKPVSYFQSFLTAYDETDGNITSSIYLVNDNYTTNKHVKGTYDIEFAVSDSSGNISNLLIKVTVGDTTKPVITGNNTKVQISYTQTWNVQTFKSTLVASDNYDTMTNANIVLESDGYTSKKTILGTYNVVFALTDASGNKTTFTKQIEVIDDIAPTWTGPTSINKPLTSILTLNDIKDQLTATDEKEGNVNASIKVLTDEYTGNGSKTGSYSIVFEASDSKGNKSTRTVVIIVQDNLPPVWYIQDGVSIKLVPPTVLTQQQIVDLIIATGQLNITSQTRVRFKVDNYTGNETVPGVYMMTLAYSDTNGNEGEHEVSITVLETEDDEPITVDPGNNLWDGIVNIYDSVIEWITTNPYLAAASGLVLILIGFTGIALLSNKRRY